MGGDDHLQIDFIEAIGPRAGAQFHLQVDLGRAGGAQGLRRAGVFKRQVTDELGHDPHAGADLAFGRVGAFGGGVFGHGFVLVREKKGAALLSRDQTPCNGEGDHT